MINFKNILFELSNVDGIGNIKDASGLAFDMLSKYCPCEKTDNLKVIGFVKGDSDYTLMLDAHIDQIGMVVTNVDNMREPFKIEKLTESIVYATYCTDVENVFEIVETIEKKLLSMQQQEISTEDIVRVSLDVLMEVSAMACLVYYTQHTNSQTFDDIRRFINR